jgi:DNA repair protein RadA/Sms
MKKGRTIYTCTECGGSSPKWQGQCPHCSAWNTLVETLAEAAPTNRFSAIAGSGKLQRLAEISPREETRVATGIEEFDRVLGGGLVAGGVVLIGGDPGIGKSTLLLQALAQLAGARRRFTSPARSRASRWRCARGACSWTSAACSCWTEIHLEKILAALAEHQPRIAVIDSIQTLYSDALQSAPGSVAQVRECAAQLTRYAKQAGTCIVFVGHVTKEGALAGPRVLEHIVDTVLYFEGDPNSSFRLVRAARTASAR